MNTFRIGTRRAHAARGLAGVDLRALAILVALSAASFACAFALGRVASPTGAARVPAPPIVSVVSTGSGVPMRLGSAPGVGIQAGAVGGARSGAPRQTLAGAAAGASSQALAAESPSREGLGTEASGSPQQPTSSAPASSPEQAVPSPSQPPANRGSSGGGAGHAPRPSAGKSFDTSG